MTVSSGVRSGELASVSLENVQPEVMSCRQRRWLVPARRWRVSAATSVQGREHSACTVLYVPAGELRPPSRAGTTTIIRYDIGFQPTNIQA